MNELDLTTKIEGLKKAIAEHKDFTGTYESQLVKAELELKDLGKIALPPVVFDDIYEAVEEGINNFDWSDTDNYNIEYGIEYDGKVHCEHFELSHSNDLVEMIVKKVSRVFTEMECPEDELDTTEDDNHPVEKLQN